MKLERPFGAAAARFVRSVSHLAAGTAVAQAAPLLATPVLARLYSPAEFGEFGVFAAILLGFSLVVSGRYEIAVPIPDSADEAFDLFAVSVALSLAACLVLALAVAAIAFGPTIEPLVRLVSPSVLSWLPLGVFASALTQSCSYWLTRTHRFAVVGRARVAQGLSTAALGIGLGVLGVRAGLVVSLVLGFIASAATVAAVLLKHDGHRLPRLSLSRMRSVAWSHRQFPLLNCPHALLDSVRESGTLIVFGALFGPTSTGYLSQTLRILRAPMSLIGQSVAQVFFPEASRLQASGRSIRELTSRTMLALLALSVPMYLLVALAGPALFSFVLGSEWLTAGEYARFLSPWLSLVLVVSSLSLLPVIRDEQPKAFALNVAETVSRLAAIVVGSVAGGAFGALLGMSFAGLTFAAVQLLWFRRLSASPSAPAPIQEGSA